MPLSTSHLAYQAQYDLLDQAVKDDIRVRVADSAAAFTLRSRLNKARAIDRDRNREVYEPGDPLYGTSIYDCLIIRIKNIRGAFWIYLEKDRMAGKVERLSEVEEEPDLPPPLRIEPIKRRELK